MEEQKKITWVSGVRRTHTVWHKHVHFRYSPEERLHFDYVYIVQTKWMEC
jgi:hypothetical protein